MKIDRAIEILEEIRNERGNVEVVWERGPINLDTDKHRTCVIELTQRRFPGVDRAGSRVPCAAVISE